MSGRRRRVRPSTTIKQREDQVIAKAIDLAEKQIDDGTASSQVITHYLKLGTTREELEQSKLREENELLRAKVEGLQSAKRVEELYEEALDAMRQYAGQVDVYEEDEEYYDDY